MMRHNYDNQYRCDINIVAYEYSLSTDYTNRGFPIQSVINIVTLDNTSSSLIVISIDSDPPVATLVLSVS